MVVWFAAHDGHGTVELLDEDETNHLVGEGHLRKAQFLVGGGIDLWRESVGAADDEGQTLADGLHLLLHPGGKLHAAHFLAVFIEQDHVVARL